MPPRSFFFYFSICCKIIQTWLNPIFSILLNVHILLLYNHFLFFVKCLNIIDQYIVNSDSCITHLFLVNMFTFLRQAIFCFSFCCIFAVKEIFNSHWKRSNLLTKFFLIIESVNISICHCSFLLSDVNLRICAHIRIRVDLKKIFLCLFFIELFT